MSNPETSKWLPKIQASLTELISYVPKTSEPKNVNPAVRSKQIISSAAMRAAMVAGGLAIPPGPLGLLTILPDLFAIWRIQAQMVADIAGAFGKELFLGKEQMLYCLFKQAGSQIVRDLVARVGERLLIRRASLRVAQKILQRIGIRVTQRITARVISRWIPVVGATGIAAYAYWDTKKVGETTIDFFSQDIGLDPGEELVDIPDQTPIPTGSAHNPKLKGA